MSMLTYDGKIKAGDLRKLISEIADDEFIMIMTEEEDSGVGYNALDIEFSPNVQFEGDDDDEHYECCEHVLRIVV